VAPEPVAVALPGVPPPPVAAGIEP
jgi:hypothetical protein